MARNTEYDPSISINGDTVLFTGPGGLQKQLPYSLWEQVVNDYNKNNQSFNDSYARTQAELNAMLADPNHPAWTQPSSGPTDRNSIIQSYQNTLNSLKSQGSSPQLDPRNISGMSPELSATLTNNLASPTYGNFQSELDAARSSQIASDQASNRPFYRTAVKTAVPAAIGLGAAALGGAALAPGLFAGGATGISTGNAAGGLSSMFGGFAPKAALTGALKGGIGGYLSGGGLGDALKGAALGGVTGGYGSALAGGLGLTGAGANAFTSALTGAAGGLAQGDLKSAGIGAALGGGLGYVTGGGNVPGLGNAAETINWNQGGSSVLNPGSGVLGSLTKSSTLSGGGGLNLGSLFKIGGSIYEDNSTRKNNDEIEKLMLAAQGRAMDTLSPFSQNGTAASNQLRAALSGGFNPGDLTQDPGYQFRLKEGQDAIQKGLAAQGLGQSGAAIKAAANYNQGLAETSYNDAFNRWMSQNSQLANQASQGLNAAGGVANLYSDMGGIQAQIAAANQQSKNKMLSSILSGLGGF